MSLLMDALKQAENAKRGSKQETSTPPAKAAPAVTPEEARIEAQSELSLAPVDAASTARPESTVFETAQPSATVPEPLNDSADSGADSARVEADSQTAASGMPPATPTHTDTPSEASEIGVLSLTPNHSDHSAQAAARVLGASEARIAQQRQLARLGLIGLGVTLSLAIGGYYYWSSLQYAPAQISLPTPQALDSVATDTPVLTELSDAATSNEATPLPKQTAWRDGPAPTQDDTGWQPAPVDARVLRGERPSAAAEAFDAVEVEAAVAEAPPPSAIRINRSSRPDRVIDQLQTAYLDYQAGRFTQAADGYRQVLANEPANRDALLGLAAVAVQRGEPETARGLYRELLRLDPKDSAAHAALASLQTQPSIATESALKQALVEQPATPQLHFALANLYAAQARWPQAQQAYFEAQRLAPQHPDYAFNLAVSLEHLGQSDAAMNYYRRALLLATRQTPVFDIAVAEQRVSALSGAPRP